MHFLFTLCAAIVSFSLGAVFASLVCMLVETIVRAVGKKDKSWKRHPYHFSAVCVMLSFAVASAALAIIFIPNLTSFFSFSKNDAVYYAAVFVVGGVCLAFPKICLSAFAALYVILCVFTAAVLHTSFGFQTGTIPVSVAADSVSVAGVSYVARNAPGDTVSVWFAVYTLPDKLLVPFARTWYFPAGISSRPAAVPAENSSAAESANSQTAVSEQNRAEAPALSEFTLPAESEFPTEKQRKSPLAFFYTYLFSSPSAKPAVLPAASVYPALYSVTSVRRLAEISFSAARSF